MKKLVLSLCVIGVAAMMTSCLEGNNSHTEQGFVMIATSTEVSPLVRYGRSSTGRSITHPTIQTGIATIGGQTVLIEPNNFYFFTYVVEPANGRTFLGESGGHRRYADNVEIIGQITPVDRMWLNLMPAPDGVPEERFAGFSPGVLFYQEAWYWRDHWIVGFQYVGGTAGFPEVTFYKRETSDTAPNDIEIDVRISGIPQATPPQQPQLGGHTLALNMSDIRRYFERETNRTVRVRFNYYTTGQGQAQTAVPGHTPWISWTLRGTGQQ